MKKKTESAAAAILEEITRLYNAREEKRKAAAEEVAKANAVIEQLQRDRVAAVERGDIDAVCDIDDRIRRQQTRCEVAEHYKAHAPGEKAETVEALLAKLREVMSAAENDSRDELIAIREQARREYIAHVAIRKTISKAYAMLQEIASDDMQKMRCNICPPGVAKALMQIGTVYDRGTDGDNPIIAHSWKANI